MVYADLNVIFRDDKTFTMVLRLEADEGMQITGLPIWQLQSEGPAESDYLDLFISGVGSDKWLHQLKVPQIRKA